MANDREAIEERRVGFRAAPRVYRSGEGVDRHSDDMGQPLRALGRPDEAHATHRDRMTPWNDGPPSTGAPRRTTTPPARSPGRSRPSAGASPTAS